ncbi:MAG TPA: hypothetical protein VEF03_06360, partial [Candidatus Binataceae bacterium]|nr:hypothetical protein [Candidatus Binataceae bacterium]
MNSTQAQPVAETYGATNGAPSRVAGDAVAREWRLASWTVRSSAMCLVLFYLLAVASPLIAPYDPAYQNRRMPDCPPMRLHLSAPSEWEHGFLYAHPMLMKDPVERIYEPDETRKTYVHLFSYGHLFTTEPDAPQVFFFGSDALGRDLFSRIVYGARVSMFVGLIGVAISFSLGITIGSLS